MSVGTKSRLREALRSRRCSLSEQNQRHHASLIASYLFLSNIFKTADTVAAYLAQDGEVDLADVIGQLREEDKLVVVPKVQNQEMSFVEFKEDSALKANQFGIEEPFETSEVNQDQINVALVPLVAFTNRGVRLGRGGGYYDRYFAKNERSWLIGIAHEFQRVDSLSTQSWDKSLDAVVTEVGWTLCSNKAQKEIKGV